MYQALESVTESRHARILIVDDEPAMQRMLSNYLKDHNFRVSTVSGRTGLFHAMSVREPDLVILDLHLGEDDGLELLREIRAKSVVPVILVTGHRCDEIDRVVGLELGADDYITKPFSLRELLARIRSALRRRTMDTVDPSRRVEHCYLFQGWTFDQRTRSLSRPDGETVVLTKNEFALLTALVAAPRRALTREYLLQATRLHEDVFDRSIDVQILRLRRKLEDDPRDPKFIRTERGIGYVFDADVTVV